MKTVLVVEDVADLRDLLLEILKDAGYHGVGAEDGKQALEILDASSDAPCVILLDMRMPVMDGTTFLERMHERESLASLPVVIVSATAPEGLLDGVRRVLKKPVSAETLTDTVRDFCGCP